MKKALFLFFLMTTFTLSANAENEKYIALTFDDGPHTKYTLEILDILKKYDAKATFFIIGENAEKNPEIIDKIIDAGCEVGNHTWSHAYLDKKSEKEIREELSKTDALLGKLTGEKPKLFRPPGGRANDTVLKIADEFGYATVLWSKDTRDWSCPPVSDVISSALNNPSNGDIILFHDYNAKKSPTPKALLEILPKLLEQGYKTVCVSELLGL